MKEQDAHVEFDDQQVVLYVEKPDGTFGAYRTGAYMPATYLSDFMAKQKHFDSEARGQLLSGQISPIGYYLQLRSMSPADLASRVGLRTGRVKRDCTVKGFARIPVELVARYADVFDIAIADLFQLVPPALEGLTKRANTSNPFVTTVHPAGEVS